jgi:hypothetical protein
MLYIMERGFTSGEDVVEEVTISEKRNVQPVVMESPQK